MIDLEKLSQFMQDNKLKIAGETKIFPFLLQRIIDIGWNKGVRQRVDILNYFNISPSEDDAETTHELVNARESNKLSYSKIARKTNMTEKQAQSCFKFNFNAQFSLFCRIYYLYQHGFHS